MEATNSLYQDIAARTGGDIYLGVVGPVRTGKSTFIKRFMDTLVIPNMTDGYRRERANDELPQSAAGRTIMTTEPKFIPEQAAEVSPDGVTNMRVRLIDCVGYIVPSALGYIEDEQPRMVKTPWYDEEIPFNMAAEEGTRRVINEHSTVGLVITTDGSITDIPREEYAEAEARVIRELQEINKPFAVLLNALDPHAAATVALAASLQEQYGVPVLPVNCRDMSAAEMQAMLAALLSQFPIKEIGVALPRWVMRLDRTHPVRAALTRTVRGAAHKVERVSDTVAFAEALCACDYVDTAATERIDLGSGVATVTVVMQPQLFYQILGEVTGMDIADEGVLMARMLEMAQTCRQYEKIRGALEQVEATGYGIVMPEMEEMSLEEPEIIRQSGRYGVRLRAAAPSIHMMKAQITTEVSPIVGSERQSEELVSYLLGQFEEEPGRIWESNIFGTSLYGLVNEGLHNKLHHMPEDARQKLKETVERIINEGCNGLICIIV
ncbi:MAG: stage IV sporulation protein A [Clostridia bacterium]|nr:stage IV sporulation protein A [Clostridia bacterium]